MIPLVVLHMVYLQVTNPAIDPLREGLVMSLEVNIGKRGNILEVGPQNVSQVGVPKFCTGLELFGFCKILYLSRLVIS